MKSGPPIWRSICKQLGSARHGSMKSRHAAQMIGRI